MDGMPYLGLFVFTLVAFAYYINEDI